MQMHENSLKLFSLLLVFYFLVMWEARSSAENEEKRGSINSLRNAHLGEYIRDALEKCRFSGLRYKPAGTGCHEFKVRLVSTAVCFSTMLSCTVTGMG